MIIFLFGEDTYRLQKALEKLVEEYKKVHKSGLNLKILDLKASSFEKFKEEFDSTSMFNEKKLFILKNPFSNPLFKKKFGEKIEIFSKSPSEIIVFFEPNKIKSRDSFSELIKNYSKWKEFSLLNKEKIKKWIKRRFENYKMGIDSLAIEKLIDFVGNDLWQIENEIKKLVVFRKSGTITLKDIERLSYPKTETNIFRIIDSICQGEKKKALREIKEFQDRGEKLSFIFSMLKNQFRNILIIKSLLESGKTARTIKRELDIHPFVVEKCLNFGTKFQLERLKKFYRKILETDFKIKTGQISLDLGIELLIAQI